MKFFKSVQKKIQRIKLSLSMNSKIRSSERDKGRLKLYFVTSSKKAKKFKSKKLSFLHMSFLIMLIVVGVATRVVFAGFSIRNFAESLTIIARGLEYYKYESETTATTTSKAQFDSHTYSTGNFEAGKDDLIAYADTDDYLELGHYGDNAPDTSVVDWMDANMFKMCSVDEFSSGTYSDTLWDIADHWMELNATGLSNGTGYYDSEILDAGTSVCYWKYRYDRQYFTFPHE